MTNLSNSPARWELICRLKVVEHILKRQPHKAVDDFAWQIAKLAAFRESPSAFRRQLRISPDETSRFASLIQPWQNKDFAALDHGWLKLAGRTSKASFRRAYIERPRGHAKTSDMAIQIAWILLFAGNGIRGLAAAADRDQATLIWDAVRRIAQWNPKTCASLEFRKHLIVNPQTGSRLEIISSDVQSSWGALPDFVICDELCHWEKPDLWYSLFSSAAKRPNCVLVVLTNAGVGRSWHWDVREAARTSSDWYFSTLNKPQAPWITADILKEQQDLLPRPIFERLWNNVWQHSDGEFVTLDEAQACRDDTLIRRSHGQPNQQYIAAVDYAEKHDYTVGVVLHREDGRQIVDRMDVAVPKTGQPVKVSWVENWISEIAANFQPVTFIVDEYQLLGTIQKMQSRYNMHRFPFRGGRGNHALAMNLRKLLIHREIAWYSDCGRIESPAGIDNLETELASLLLKQSPSGLCRIDHHQDGVHHDDRAFTLGAASLYAINHGGDSEWLEITSPSSEGQFVW